jgi:hypothetical protein
MPGNSDPLFSRVGTVGTPVAVTAANTSSQGGGTIGTDIFKVFEADATNGSFVREVRFSATASSAGTATTATVARVFISSVTSGATTSSNTHLFADVSLPAQTADSSSTGTYPVIVPMNIALDPGYTILVTNHAAPAANTQWKAIAIGGKY